MAKKIIVFCLLLYFRFFAKLQLLKTKPTIIGIGGSSGKSSLTKLVSIVLSSKFKVESSAGKNSETGIPLAILGIHMKNYSYISWLVTILFIPLRLLIYWPKYDVFIAEMGIDSPIEPKNMSYLLKIVSPNIGIVTNVTLEHSQYFDSFIDEVNPDVKKEKVLQLIASQETLLLESLPEEAVAIINIDEKLIQDTNLQVVAKKMTISLKKEADLQGGDITNALSHFSMVISHEGNHYPLTIIQPLPKHFAYEFLLTIAVGIVKGLEIEECIENLEKNFSLPPGRASFFSGIKHTTIIDSSYNNATLPPILGMLDLLKEIAGKRRKVVVFGDMRELGQESQDIHEEAAQGILENADFAICIGQESEKYVVPILKKAGFPFENFPDVTSSKIAIQNLIQNEDIVLVKGSQNTLFLERIVEMLLLDKTDAAKLARRGKFWDKKRAETL